MSEGPRPSLAEEIKRMKKDELMKTLKEALSELDSQTKPILWKQLTSLS